MPLGATRRASAGRLTAVALLAVGLVPMHAGAQEGVSFVVHTTSWGMTDGQTARFTVLNSGEASTRLPPRDIFVQVTLLNARGDTIAMSDDIAVPPHEF